MKKRWLSNENQDLTESKRNDIIVAATHAAENLLDALGIAWNEDPNCKETPNRIAKMFVNEIFRGRYEKRPDLKAFPNTKKYDQIYLTGPLEIRSTCAHHFQPIVGSAWVGIFPGKNVLGLSKFNRITDWVASRPTIQEDLTEQIGEEIQKATKAKGVAVIIKASHFCVTQRGVKAHQSDMTTSVMRGCFRKQQHLKQEFLALVAGMKGYHS